MLFCALCNGPIQNGEILAEQITAWRVKGIGTSRRGGSDVVLRETTGRVAHQRCLDRQRSGVSVQQGQLV